MKNFILMVIAALTLTSCIVEEEIVEVEKIVYVEDFERIDELLAQVSELQLALVGAAITQEMYELEFATLNAEIESLMAQVEDENIGRIFYGLILNTGWEGCGAGAVKRLDRKIYRKVYRCINLYYILHENSDEIEIRIVRESEDTKVARVKTFKEGNDFIKSWFHLTDND